MRMNNFALRLQSSLLEEARTPAKDKARKIVDRNLHHLLDREQRPEPCPHFVKNACWSLANEARSAFVP
jgi:hypothetical protein